MSNNVWVYFPDAGWIQWLTEPYRGTAHGATIVLRNVHNALACKGRACVIHSPTDHHMRDWPLSWRADRGIFERRCEHGIGHWDPDQWDYWQETYQTYQGVHGCDGCCLKIN